MFEEPDLLTRVGSCLAHKHFICLKKMPRTNYLANFAAKPAAKKKVL
jgi:hypothetical protein